MSTKLVHARIDAENEKFLRNLVKKERRSLSNMIDIIIDLGVKSYKKTNPDKRPRSTRGGKK